MTRIIHRPYYYNNINNSSNNNNNNDVVNRGITNLKKRRKKFLKKTGLEFKLFQIKISYTVKLVYKDHASETKIVAFVDRWSFFTHPEKHINDANKILPFPSFGGLN